MSGAALVIANREPTDPNGRIGVSVRWPAFCPWGDKKSDTHPSIPRARAPARIVQLIVYDVGAVIPQLALAQVKVPPYLVQVRALVDRVLDLLGKGSWPLRARGRFAGLLAQRSPPTWRWARHGAYRGCSNRTAPRQTSYRHRSRR